jgi:hypothetical protein
VFDLVLKPFLVLIPIGLLLWYGIDDLLTGEYFVTRADTIKNIATAIHTSGKQNGIIYDLGSGRGDFLIRLIALCPGAMGHGFDRSHIKVFISRLRALARDSRAKFARRDFLKMDLFRADIIYAYLPRPLLPSLAEKLKRGIKPGAIVITSRVELPDWLPTQVISKNPANPAEEDIFIYQTLNTKY